MSAKLVDEIIYYINNFNKTITKVKICVHINLLFNFVVSVSSELMSVTQKSLVIWLYIYLPFPFSLFFSLSFYLFLNLCSLQLFWTWSYLLIFFAQLLHNCFISIISTSITWKSVKNRVSTKINSSFRLSTIKRNKIM